MLEIDDETFNENVQKRTWAFVDFHAVWCGPCRAATPMLEKIAGQFPDVDFTKCDIDDAQETSRSLKVSAVPTMILFHEGTEVKRWVGLQKESKLINELQEIMKMHETSTANSKTT